MVWSIASVSYEQISRFLGPHGWEFAWVLYALGAGGELEGHPTQPLHVCVVGARLAWDLFEGKASQTALFWLLYRNDLFLWENMHQDQQGALPLPGCLSPCSLPCARGRGWSLSPWSPAKGIQLVSFKSFKLIRIILIEDVLDLWWSSQWQRVYLCAPGAPCAWANV